MSTRIPELSVFFPSYNEEKNIECTIMAALKVAPEVSDKYEIIAINDGSSDRTGEIINGLAKKYKTVKAIHHKRNRGYGAAFKSGFYSAKYKWIAFTDSDGQFDFSEIVNFIKKQKETGADLVIGYYKKRRVSFSKILTSRVWEFMIFVFFRLHVRDIDTGFKFVSKEVINSIPKLESERGAFISSEFLVKAKKQGFKIVEIPVTHYPREKGAGTGRNLNVIAGSFLDLVRLWKKLH